MKIEAGLVLGNRYRLLSRIAIGGMGEVWRARDNYLNIIVAVKILRDEFVGQEQFLARLRVEAENAKKVTHPNLARVLDHSETDGRGWIVMEYVQGEPLSTRLKSGATIRIRELLPIMIQISKALYALHSVGVVHRDVKPANILITNEGIVKLTDFGISKSQSQPNMTAVGMVMGTAQYLAPEQVLGENASERGDIYALGIIAYEALVGNRPFSGKTQVDIAFAHVNEPLPALPSFLPPVLVNVIEKMLAKSPDDRFENANVLTEQLNKVLLQVCPDVVVPVGEVATFERPLTRRETHRVPKISFDQDEALNQLNNASSDIGVVRELVENDETIYYQTNSDKLIQNDSPSVFDETVSINNFESKGKTKIYRRGRGNSLKNINPSMGVDSKENNLTDNEDNVKVNINSDKIVPIKTGRVSKSFSFNRPSLASRMEKMNSDLNNSINKNPANKIKNVKKYFSRDKNFGETFDEILLGKSGNSKDSVENKSLLRVVFLIFFTFVIVALVGVFVYKVFSEVSSVVEANANLDIRFLGDIFAFRVNNFYSLNSFYNSEVLNNNVLVVNYNRFDNSYVNIQTLFLFTLMHKKYFGNHTNVVNTDTVYYMNNNFVNDLVNKSVKEFIINSIIRLARPVKKIVFINGYRGTMSNEYISLSNFKGFVSLMPHESVAGNSYYMENMRKSFDFFQTKFSHGLRRK